MSTECPFSGDGFPFWSSFGAIGQVVDMVLTVSGGVADIFCTTQTSPLSLQQHTTNVSPGERC